MKLAAHGEPGDAWQAWMGHWCGVQRRDMTDLTFAQIVGMFEFAQSNSGG